MENEKTKTSKSKVIALKLYDNWIETRQKRPSHFRPKNKQELQELGMKNIINQLIEPRKKHLAELKNYVKDMDISDIVALLVKLEFPVIETSSLLHKLHKQFSINSSAPYFSRENQEDNCGTGCGCGCAAMMELPYEDRIYTHMRTKPFSIDPFNELGIPEEERDGLLIKDFLESYKALSIEISENIDSKSYDIEKEHI